MHGTCGTLIWNRAAAHLLAQAHLSGDISNAEWVVLRPRESVDRTLRARAYDYPQHAISDYNNPRFRKSPRLPPEERSIMSMVNFSRQTSQASSTPWMIALSGAFVSSTFRLVRLITASIESRSVCSLRSVLRN